MAHPRRPVNKPLILLAVAAVLIAAGVRFAPAFLRHEERSAAGGAVRMPPSTGKPAHESVSTPVVAVESATGSKPRRSVPDFEKSLEQLSAAAVSSDWERVDKLLAVCMAENPKAAAAYLDAARLGGNREILLTRVAQLWTAHDPVAALQWAVKRDDAGEQESLAGAVYLKWAETDPRSAVAAAEQVGALSTTKTDVMRNLVSQWAAQDLPSCLSWVKTKPVGDQRSQLIEQVAIRLAETSPAASAKLVQEDIPPGNRHNEAIIAVLHQWALHDLPDATAWAAQFPRDSAIGNEVRQELDGIADGSGQLPSTQR